ncbi:predicted protein [Coccidioides posadasii str. Silveira]|uniref:Predicted protein n=1 Tax=Coccidioides posadasii (strain RMSCC 757 / Silveira) TaxID=443226 RepID=E9D074_COCPS|nr:predicted protein [Coccidioides posadasii str. Silveira]
MDWLRVTQGVHQADGFMDCDMYIHQRTGAKGGSTILNHQEPRTETLGTGSQSFRRGGIGSLICVSGCWVVMPGQKYIDQQPPSRKLSMGPFDNLLLQGARPAVREA